MTQANISIMSPAVVKSHFPEQKWFWSSRTLTKSRGGFPTSAIVSHTNYRMSNKRRACNFRFLKPAHMQIGHSSSSSSKFIRLSKLFSMNELCKVDSAMHGSNRISYRHAPCLMQYKNPHPAAYITPNSSARSLASCTSPRYLSSFHSHSLPFTICVMAGRSVSAVMVLGFLVVAAFCMTEASASKSMDDLLEAKVKISLLNKCSQDVRLIVGVGKVLDCKKGKLAVLGPVKVKLQALNLLKLELFVFDKNGKLLKVKGAVNVNLGLLAKLIKGVKELVLEVVEEVVAGVEGKVIKLLCGKTVLVKLVVKV